MCGFLSGCYVGGFLGFALELRNMFGLLLALFIQVRYKVIETRRGLFDQLPVLAKFASTYEKA